MTMKGTAMTKAGTLLQAGKKLVAVAAGRAFKGEPPKPAAQDVLSDPAALRQGSPAPPEPGAAKEVGQDPGNSNAVDHDDQDPEQEKA